MIAPKPCFGDGAEFFVIVDFFDVQVTVKIKDRHILCVIVVESLRRLVFQHKILVHKVFHRYQSFLSLLQRNPRLEYSDIP